MAHFAQRVTYPEIDLYLNESEWGRNLDIFGAIKRNDTNWRHVVYVVEPDGELNRLLEFLEKENPKDKYVNLYLSKNEPHKIRCYLQFFEIKPYPVGAAPIKAKGTVVATLHIRPIDTQYI